MENLQIDIVMLINPDWSIMEKNVQNIDKYLKMRQNAVEQ